MPQDKFMGIYKMESWPPTFSYFFIIDFLTNLINVDKMFLKMWNVK